MYSCESCGNDFLTESDPHVVRPTRQGNKLYCYCHIKGFDEVENKIKELQAENLRLSTIVSNQKTVIEINQADNAKLRECVEFYADQNSYKCLIEDHHITVFVVNSDTEPPFNSSVRMVGGKRARQVLKELEGK